MKTEKYLPPVPIQLAAVLRAAAAHGLSLSALQALCLMEAAGGAESMTGIARAMGRTAANLTGVMDTLESKGLAERKPKQGDRRTILATMTYGGHVLMSDILNA